MATGNSKIQLEDAGGDIVPELEAAGDQQQKAAGDAKQVRCCCRTMTQRTCAGITLCSCCGVLGLLVFVLAIAIGAFAGPQISTLQKDVRSDTHEGANPSNLMGTTWLPGCAEGSKTDSEIDECGGSCFNSTLIRQIEGFYKQNGFQLVNFSSRTQNPVTISAWYIPPAPGMVSGSGPAPRVVVQHGTNSNQNKFDQQIVSFFLASAGYGVLVPSLQDHGWSGDSKLKLFTWGWEYPDTLLAAWDYAKTDPDGLLGGALPSSKVGLYGVSMGGFTAANAFGMRDEIPAAFLDAPVWSVKEILFSEMRKVLGVPLAGLGLEFAWAFANNVVQLHFNWPGKVLPRGPTTARKLYLVENTKDSTVPASQLSKYREFISTNTDKYVLAGSWRATEECNGENHRMDSLSHPSEYRMRLCTFWTEVFGEALSKCTSPAMWPIYG